MKSFAILWVFLLPLKLFAFSISGRVVDRGSTKPLAGAQVFINQSTLYSLSDSSGNYVVENINDSLVEVVVAVTGYETLIYKASALKPVMNIRFEMVPLVRKYEKENPELKTTYEQLFIANFLGESQNAYETYILNPGVLRYRFNDTTKELTVTATSMLQIINDGLGYMINYQLESFSLFTASGWTDMLGYCFYKNLNTQKPAITNKWEERRRMVYDGSLLHFMRAFYQGKADGEGFKLRNVRRIFEEESGYKAAVKSKSTLLKAGVLIVNRQEKKYADVADKNLLPAESVRSVDHNEVILSGADRLLIEYKNQHKNDQFAGLSSLPDEEQFSVFHLMPAGIRIQKNGSYFEKLDLYIEGNMKDRLSEMLPIDYNP